MERMKRVSERMEQWVKCKGTRREGELMEGQCWKCSLQRMKNIVVFASWHPGAAGVAQSGEKNSRAPNRTTEPWTGNLQDRNLSVLSKVLMCWSGKTSNKTHLSRFHSGNTSSKCRLFFFYWSRSLQNTLTSKKQQPIISFEWNVPIYRHTLEEWFFTLTEYFWRL